VLLGIGLIMALPVLGRQAARAASQAELVPCNRPLIRRWLTVSSASNGARARPVRASLGSVGYVYNEYREDAVNVQLRISELDPSGQAVASIDQPVADTVPAGGRVFFDARVPGLGPS
jgi:hypothetical protein